MARRMTEITPQIVADHGLSEEEYARVLNALGREPNSRASKAIRTQRAG